MTVEIFLAIGGLLLAGVFWMIPSPIGRKKRGLEQGELVALRKLMEQLPGLISATVKTAVKEALVADLEKQAEKLTPVAMAEIDHKAQASATAAVTGFFSEGGGEAFKPWVSFGGSGGPRPWGDWPASSIHPVFGTSDDRREGDKPK